MNSQLLLLLIQPQETYTTETYLPRYVIANVCLNIAN